MTVRSSILLRHHAAGRLRRRCGWLLVGLSLALHLLTVFAYSRQPDWLAAFTMLPVWVWGGIGLILSIIAFWSLRASLSLIVTGIWAVTILLAADEARVITRLSHDRPLPGPAGSVNGKPVLRVLTLNCKNFDYDPISDPAADIAMWDPDIVLLQEINIPQMRKVAAQLYGDKGDSRWHSGNAIVTRWKITREVRNLVYRDQQVTVQMPDDGPAIEVLNIHLATAPIDARFWRPACWKAHSDDRRRRRTEISAALGLLASEGGNRPAIVGGDFNAPAGDPIHRIVSHQYADAFAAVGSGWGNTFQRRIPIHRIDRIHASSQFVPVRCAPFTTRYSDHRMVIADLLIVAP